MSAILYPERDFGDDWWPGDDGPLRDAARWGLAVHVLPELPFESTDPERPGWVHALHVKPPTSVETKDGFGFDLGPLLKIRETLFVSRQLFDALKKHTQGRA